MGMDNIGLHPVYYLINNLDLPICIMGQHVKHMVRLFEIIDKGVFKAEHVVRKLKHPGKRRRHDKEVFPVGLGEVLLYDMPGALLMSGRFT